MPTLNPPLQRVNEFSWQQIIILVVPPQKLWNINEIFKLSGRVVTNQEDLLFLYFDCSCFPFKATCTTTIGCAQVFCNIYCERMLQRYKEMSTSAIEKLCTTIIIA